MNIMLIGPQGSGKGTQAQLLEEQLNLKACASGELLRDAIARGTPLGMEAKPYYDNGDLVPDEVVARLVLERLKELKGADGIILDGFPRTIAQAKILDRLLTQVGQRINVVFYLEVPREVLLDRLGGRYLCRAHNHVWNIKTHPTKVPGICDYDGSELYQRSDDTGEAIARRLDVFFTETIQLLNYYEAQHKLVRIDGQKSIEEVHRQIMESLQNMNLNQSPDSRWRRLWHQISNVLPSNH
ncbi:MAG: adenylate kinase [Ktedonobacterales bacterium]